MFTATLENQFFIETPNNSGVASELASVVADRANANIRAFWGTEFNNAGQFYLITDNNVRVSDFLSKNGFDNFREEQVLIIRAPDERGSVSEVTQRLSSAGLNIQFLWTTVFDNEAAIVVHTDNNEKAWKLFQ